ncbi:MAG: hypothetical protein ACHQT9_02970 [Candidatus Saccharimonadales bacterium]
MKQANRHNALNAKQVHILKLTYKFRFITAPLLAEYKGLSSRHSMYMTLERLASQDYLGKRVDANTDFQNKGARYFLTPDSFKELRDKHGLSERTKFAIYKNKSVSEDYIDGYITVLRVYLALRNAYPDTFHIFTSTELMDYDYMPEYHPDLYLNRIKASKTGVNEYILYNLTSTQFYVFKKQFDKLLEHFDSGEWEAAVETDYPAILLVVSDGKQEKKLQEYIAKVMDNSGIDDLSIYTTTIKALLQKDIPNTAIWSKAQEPGVLTQL